MHFDVDVIVNLFPFLALSNQGFPDIHFLWVIHCSFFILHKLHLNLAEILPAEIPHCCLHAAG